MDEQTKLNFRYNCLQLASELVRVTSGRGSDVVAEAELLHQWLTATAAKTETNAGTEKP